MVFHISDKHLQEAESKECNPQTKKYVPCYVVCKKIHMYYQLDGTYSILSCTKTYYVEVSQHSNLLIGPRTFIKITLS